MSAPWHLGMMCAFDTETTGPDPESARVVTACIARVDGSGKMPPESRTWLIDPGTEIPEAATAVHGITTEHAREHGCSPASGIAEITGELIRVACSAVPVVAYNGVYDFTVLDRESRRNGLSPFGDEFDAAKGAVIDPLVLDKAVDPYRKGSRTLSAACEFYKVRIDSAHDSAHDAIAAARVAWKIAARYPHIARMSLTELHAFQVTQKRRQAASFEDYLRRQGDHKVIDGSWPVVPFKTEEAA